MINSAIRRPVYCLLNPRSLSYARMCLESLLRNSIDPISLTLLTDRPEDVASLVRVFEQMGPEDRHSWRVIGQEETDGRADDFFREFPNLRKFRRGHPCWRKLTDPAFYSASDSEIIVIDPDVYFPNRFTFEPTPALGILLMWQRPNCLYPPEVVRLAFDRSVAMADHVDIGVSQWRAAPVIYLLEEILGRIGVESLPAWSMHVESVMWAALAMELGGGYLDPGYWHCWDHSPAKRLRLRLTKTSGLDLLEGVPFKRLKCFHAGGVAKHWLAGAEASGLFEIKYEIDEPSPISPFVEYRRAKHERKQWARKAFQSLGVLRLVGTD